MRDPTLEFWEERLRAYCSLMAELNMRYKSIFAVGQAREVIPDLLAYEFCYLQFRMMCEVMALTCLLAHGDIQLTKLEKTYQADFIMKALEKLHPKFFPQPASMGPDGFFELTTSGFMTREELISLYRECGEILHRGSITQYSKHLNWTRIRPCVLKFQVLTQSHLIALRTKPFAIHFVMRCIPTNQPKAALIEWPFDNSGRPEKVKVLLG